MRRSSIDLATVVYRPNHDDSFLVRHGVDLRYTNNKKQDNKRQLAYDCQGLINGCWSSVALTYQRANIL